MTNEATAKPGDALHPRTEICARCRFWLPGNRHELSGERPDRADMLRTGDWSHGLCRRNPPTFLAPLVAAAVMPPRYGQHIDANDAMCAITAGEATYFPGTFGDEHCGEFDWQDRLRPSDMPC